MEMFKLSVKRSDFNYAKKVYEEIILTHVLNNDKIIKAYKGLYGMPDEELVNVKQARMYLFSLFNNENNLKSLNILEDVDPDYNNDIDALLIQIHEYQDELDYNDNLTANERRSLRMRINHLNKKLKEKEGNKNK